LASDSNTPPKDNDFRHSDQPNGWVEITPSAPPIEVPIEVPIEEVVQFSQLEGAGEEKIQEEDVVVPNNLESSQEDIIGLNSPETEEHKKDKFQNPNGSLEEEEEEEEEEKKKMNVVSLLSDLDEFPAAPDEPIITISENTSNKVDVDVEVAQQAGKRSSQQSSGSSQSSDDDDDDDGDVVVVSNGETTKSDTALKKKQMEGPTTYVLMAVSVVALVILWEYWPMLVASFTGLVWATALLMLSVGYPAYLETRISRTASAFTSCSIGYLLHWFGFSPVWLFVFAISMVLQPLLKKTEKVFFFFFFFFLFIYIYIHISHVPVFNLSKKQTKGEYFSPKNKAKEDAARNKKKIVVYPNQCRR